MRGLVAVALASLSVIGVSYADAALASMKKMTSIDAQDLESALKVLARERDLQLVYRTDIVGTRRTPGITGDLSAEEALSHLLEGASLTYRYLDEKTITIVPIATVSASSAVVKAPVGKAANRPTGMRTAAPRSWWSSLRLAQAENRDGESSASSQPKGAEDREARVEEVVVTAQKREQRLQDVPFGISALTSQDLERIGATGAEDYLAQVPGVHYSSNGRGRSPIVIRGVATDGVTVGTNNQPTVEMYLDELPLYDRWAAWSRPDIGTFDIERVEVLRGPQGTLFGSGAMGGVVRLITNKPNMTDFQARLELSEVFTKGGNDGNGLGGMINAPLIQDKLAVRLVGYRRTDGGYVENVTRHQSNTDDGAESGMRLMLDLKATDALKLGFTYFHDQAEIDDIDKAFSSDAYGPKEEWNGIIPESSDTRLNIYSLTADYEFEAAALTSTTTYAARDFQSNNDLVRILEGIANTGQDPYNNVIFNHWNTKRFAQEARVISQTEGPLDWTVGAFFMDVTTDFDFSWDLGPERIHVLGGPSEVKTRELAGFGESTYRFGDRWSVTAGARWFYSRFESDSPGEVSLLTPAPERAYLESSATALTPKFSISFFPRGNLHSYITASKGYRTGQANQQPQLSQGLVPAGTEPDSLWNYELGMKSGWRDGRIVANVSAFYIDWSKIQLTRYVLLPSGLNLNILDNAGTANIKGVEAELAFHPTDRFTLGTSLTYNDATLKSIKPGVPLTPGSKLPGSAEFSASSYVESKWRAGSDSDGYLRLSHRYVGKVYGDINNGPLVASDAYHELDARVGAARNNLELSLYVNNLFDRRDAVVRQIASETVPYAFRLRPRTVGVTFRADF